MRNRVALAGGWLLATALAVAVASQAVDLVADRAAEVPVQLPPAVVTQASLVRDVPGGQATRPGSGTTSTTQPDAATPPASTIPTTPPGSTATTQTTTTIAGPTTTPTTVVTSTTTTTGLEAGTFAVTGGHVSARCTGSQTIELLGAVPAAGWSAEVESSGPEKVRVDFELGEQESEVEVLCREGRLKPETSG